MTTAYLGITTILFASSVMKQHIPWWRNTESLLFGGYGGCLQKDREHTPDSASIYTLNAIKQTQRS